MAISSSEFKFLGLGLLGQITVSLILAIVMGLLIRTGVFPFLEANTFSFLSEIFFASVKMVIPPLIFCSIASGTLNLGGGKDTKRILFKCLFLFLSTATLAVFIGLFCGFWIKAGQGVPNPDIASGQTAIGYAQSMKDKASDFTLLPMNPFKAMAEERYLQIIYFAFFTGLVINVLRQKYIITINKMSEELHHLHHTAWIPKSRFELFGRQSDIEWLPKDIEFERTWLEKINRVARLIEDFTPVTFKMIEFIVRFAPLAVFGAMSASVANQGMDALYNLRWFFVAFVLAMSIQYCVFGLFIRFIGKLSPFQFYKKVIPVQSVAFSTASSKSTLQVAMNQLHEKMGVSEKHTRFILPLGASINLDATAIYLGLCALFFAQMMEISLSFHQYLVLIISCTIGSVGGAGIPSGAMVFLGVICHSVGIPLTATHIGMILAVDSLLDRVRTAINLTGDCALTLIISHTEKGVDETVYAKN